MRFTDETKKSLRLYILEKIKQNTASLSRSVAEGFGVNQATVHSYINDMVSEGIIVRTGRGEYELVKKVYNYSLSREYGDLDSDIIVYNRCLLEHIKDLPDNVRGIWEYSFSEMVNNVMDHSMAEHLQVIVTQDFLDTQTVIIDDGVGIFEKIRSYFSLPTLDDAVQELFKGKMTTDEKNHSGEGIFFTSKLMDIFFILSDGKVFTINRYDESRVFDVPVTDSGTIVMMQLSNFSNKHAKDVFDLYEDGEGGFAKTRIPLKNMFDASPVSRSQAKRVCNRLNEFREVIFDFDEIPWMGQGFAHQIFVVFQNEHPEILLVPVNMNESVEKMYRHVLP